MKTYTVVGFYEDTGQRVVQHWTASDPFEAINNAFANSFTYELVVVEVFEGKLLGLTESSRIEYQSDFEGEDE